MATVVLTVVGTIFGGPVGGALGALAGRAIDQAVLFKPKGREGPRLSDLQVQTSTYGTQVPRIFGAMRVAGTVIWATDLKESRKRSGGGKGRPKVTTYSYSVSLAVALSARRVRRVGRIWADGNLLRGAAGDFKSAAGAFRLHDGSEDQPVDPLIASARGIALTPAHRGIAYAVFEDLQLADFGNRIPSLTFEIFGDEGAVTVGTIAGELSGGMLSGGEEASVAGYAASGSDVRAALQPLVEGHGLAVRDGIGGLVLGAGDDAGTLPADRLIARLNGKAVTPRGRVRAPIETVPVRLAVRHYDPARDYQAGVQKALRPGAGRREETVDLPAAIDAARAKALAADGLALRRAGRERMTLHCGWPALLHAAGSTVTVEGEAGRWRIEDSEWEAMGVRLNLRRVPGGGGAPAAASAGEAVRQPDLPHGPTVLMLADLPVLDDAPPTRPVVVAAAAGVSAGWRQAALFTVDPMSDAAVPAEATAPEAVMGSVAGVLPDGTALLFDDRATIEVVLLNGGMELDGASDDSLGRGANLCLVGDELIQFGQAEQVGPATWRLARLLRGRRGTEWAMAGHGPGERFLMIEADRLASVPESAVQRGTSLKMLAIGIGDAVPAQAAIGVTGEALMPPAPVHVRTAPDGAGGLSVAWTRRSRAGWRWSDGIDAPLGEERERYMLRLMAGDVPVRTVETAVPAWTYTAAMAAADGGAGHGGPLTLEIRQVGTHAAGRAATILLPI